MPRKRWKPSPQRSARLPDLTPPLGIIEGFYGRPWSWADRRATLTRLAAHGYGFYLYAPKGDPFLRRRWQKEHPPEMAQQLADLSAHCHSLGLRFGVGLSPYELYAKFGAGKRAALGRKLDFLNSLGLDDLAILFDDMQGDRDDLAARQLEIIDFVASRAKASRLIVCPTYYTDDPILDQIFGQRPADYVETLGRDLDQAIGIFWTGDKVCSTAIAPDYLDDVATRLWRKPLLWDNYPVNDGHVMSQYLYLRGFQNRPAAIGAKLSGHGINPALQPTLTCIPALTLAALYREGEGYNADAAWMTAATDVLGADFAAQLRADVPLLQDIGLDTLTPDQQAELRSRYGVLDHPAAREIISWLDGAFRMTREEVKAQ